MQRWNVLSWHVSIKKMQLNYTAYKIRLSCGHDKVHEWADYMHANKQEVSQSLAQENVRHEMWFYGEDESGSFVIGVMDCDDVKKASDTAKHSTLSVDRVHRAFKQFWGEREKLTIDESQAPNFPNTVCVLDARP